VTTPIRRQRGTTLVIALIMLVLLSLFAVSSLNTANTNLKVVGNMQSRSEALNASQQTIEAVLSTPQFIANPANAVPAPCGAANTTCTDVTGDGVADFTTTLLGPEPSSPAQPTCVTVKPIKNADLVLTSTEDLGCSSGQQQQFGVAGAVTGDSLCSNSIWEIKARTTGATTGASVTVTQGVGVRISSDDAGTSC
jgi:Tfp pilus assembly protein PilX